MPSQEQQRAFFAHGHKEEDFSLLNLLRPSEASSVVEGGIMKGFRRSQARGLPHEFSTLGGQRGQCSDRRQHIQLGVRYTQYCRGKDTCFDQALTAHSHVDMPWKLETSSISRYPDIVHSWKEGLPGKFYPYWWHS